MSYSNILKLSLRSINNGYGIKTVIKNKRTILCQITQSYATKNILKLSDRGLWNDRFPSSSLNFEQSLVSTNPQTIYSGFDPTSDSLHIGNLLVLVALLHCQRSGHHVIALIGGATGKIGDPSGKRKERPLLQSQILKSNSDAIEKQITTIFENHEKYIWKKNISSKDLYPIRLKNNLEWYEELNVLNFLRGAGKHISINQLLKRTSIKSRLDNLESLSFTEFAYQILQAWDWYHLYKNYECTIQIGGSDQMGNIISGHDLIRNKLNVEVTGLTVPLLTSNDGNKFSKSSGSPLWLCPSKTSPFDFYQRLYRTSDDEVEQYLRLLTLIPLAEIEAVMKLHLARSSECLPQKKLAEHLTLLVHGENGLRVAKQGTELLFGKNSTVLASMSKEEVESLFQGSSMSSQILEPGMTVLDVAMKANCFRSTGRAIPIFEAGGFHINEAKIVDPNLAFIPQVHTLPNGLTLIRVGKCSSVTGNSTMNCYVREMKHNFKFI